MNCRAASRGIVIGSITLLGVLNRVFPVLPAP